MPIYEFYCHNCNTIFNFFSKVINTEKIPLCPHCKTKKLARQMSAFAFTGKARENNDMDDISFDDNKIERAMSMLTSQAGKLNEDDPRQAANLMRKLTDITGLELGTGMNEALRRLENGENPEKIEADMENILEEEDPFLIPAKKSNANSTKKPIPKRDQTLYDL